ncbi:MAG: nucleotidyltransferase family protein [Intrasporangium sp.]|uniref:nucleotidyltransferase family protein n=1 Tax=Intrasporangium sp. TaxID=1925024 RepID=UPI003F805CDD
MSLSSLPPVRGLVLAAGAGRRMGGPKALLPGPGGGTLVEAAIHVLLDGGCAGVTVVVGAERAAVRAIVEGMPEGADGDCEIDVVVCADWDEGMGASMRTGLSGIRDRAESAGVEAVLVTLVDLPDVTPAVVQRLLYPHDAVGGVVWRRELRRAAYDGRPGHPALLGRDFWAETIATAVGDRGARDVYAAHPHDLVECGDLATGRDVDTREEASMWGLPSAERGRE